ncbi:hypothetical protein MRB53_038800 [Persea americana]|nr:hypothetical protein MRB53_038800 [Persea americana]
MRAQQPLFKDLATPMPPLDEEARIQRPRKLSDTALTAVASDTTLQDGTSPESTSSKTSHHDHNHDSHSHSHGDGPESPNAPHHPSRLHNLCYESRQPLDSASPYSSPFSYTTSPKASLWHCSIYLALAERPFARLKALAIANCLGWTQPASGAPGSLPYGCTLPSEGKASTRRVKVSMALCSPSRQVSWPAFGLSLAVGKLRAHAQSKRMHGVLFRGHGHLGMQFCAECMRGNVHRIIMYEKRCAYVRAWYHSIKLEIESPEVVALAAAPVTRCSRRRRSLNSLTSRFPEHAPGCLRYQSQRHAASVLNILRKPRKTSFEPLKDLAHGLFPAGSASYFAMTTLPAL